MFQGTYTALVTPFGRDGRVDYGRLRDLVEWQIASGVEGFVPAGTTGESPTLDYDEHHKVIEEVVVATRKRVQVIAGTGGNSTREAMELTQHAKDAGADATLQVTPYYNKPTSAGLIKHFTAVAQVGLPVVLYNVPGRAGREIPLDVIVKLAAHPDIVAIKEAGGSVERVSQIVRQCNIEVLSGDDSLTVPMMSVGARGVVSVASNVAPKVVGDMVRHILAGRWEEGRKMHLQYYGLFADLFIESNPLPVKAALAMMGRIEEVYRLPLCEMEEKNRAVLEKTLRDLALAP